MSLAAPDAAPVGLAPIEALYRYDTLYVRQKLLTVAQRYQVDDDWGQPRFWVVRPPRLFLNILVNLAATLVGYIALGLVLVAIIVWQNLLAAALIYFTLPPIAAIGARLLAPYRNIRVHADEGEQVPLLLITQDTKLALRSRYTLYEPDGTEVARFERDNLAAILRRSWTAFTPEGAEICRVREDSWVKALLRRYLGPMYGLLRTNFIFQFPDGTTVGKYDRQLTLLDQYVLDLTEDRYRLLDRRVALAFAILLDSAESR